MKRLYYKNYDLRTRIKKKSFLSETDHTNEVVLRDSKDFISRYGKL